MTGHKKYGVKIKKTDAVKTKKGMIKISRKLKRLPIKRRVSKL